MKTRLILTAFSLLSFVFVGKANNPVTQQDSTGPRVTLIAPGENDILQIGKAIHFDMELSDDVMLGTYRVEIHNNDDGHAHNGTTEGIYPSVFDKTYDVSGSKQQNVHHHGIVIPADAKEGLYHFMIYATDASGNTTQLARTVLISKQAGTNYHH